MSRKSGQMKRLMSRLFKERQIYHRSDGVVHFISMSTKTQVALAIVAVGALMWVAYATVNVVFKEQIIVSNEQKYRLTVNNHTRNMQEQKRAYDEVNIQNAVLKENSKAALDELANRLQVLQGAVARQSAVADGLETLSENLSQAGSPNGQRPKNANRIMIDVKPAEATPRQSRKVKLKKAANREAFNTRIDIQRNNQNANAVDSLETAVTDLYTQQLLLLAELEEKSSRQAEELRHVLASTGINVEKFITPPKIANSSIASGGPFIDFANLDTASPIFIQRINRTVKSLDELEGLRDIIEHIPLSSPSISSRKINSRFGTRRDPINNKLSQHNGLDFGAAYASPVTATAPGIVKAVRYSKTGYGRMVEIDHGNGFITRYAHMRRISVKKGQKIKLHDKVGELGNTGRSTGPHIHYEIWYKGIPQNPERFIEAGRYVFES